MDPRRVSLAIGLIATATVLVAGCASGKSSTGIGSPAISPSLSTSGSTTPTASPTGPVATTPPPANGTNPSPVSTAEQTLTGQVEAGVEPSCKILHSGGTSYLLLGGDPAVVAVGNNISVTGHLVTGIMSYCMQGRPFQITTAHKM
jgi:hypothetical protein